MYFSWWLFWKLILLFPFLKENPIDVYHLFNIPLDKQGGQDYLEYLRFIGQIQNARYLFIQFYFL